MSATPSINRVLTIHLSRFLLCTFYVSFQEEHIHLHRDSFGSYSRNIKKKKKKKKKCPSKATVAWGCLFFVSPEKGGAEFAQCTPQLKSGVRLLWLNRPISDVFCTPLPVGELLGCHVRVGDSISVSKHGCTSGGVMVQGFVELFVPCIYSTAG